MGIAQELNFRLAFIGCFAALGAVGFGFDNGWWGSALGLPAFQRKYGSLDPTLQAYTIPAVKISAGTGTGSAGVILGSLIAPWLCQRLGRKPTLLVMSAIMCLGVLLEATAITSFWQLVVGRIIVYAGIGLAANVVPMYQSECAPAKLRGAFLSSFSIGVNFGLFLSALVVYRSQGLGGGWPYLTVIILQLMVPVGVMLSYPFLPETPRWLVYRGRFEDAEKVVQSLYGPTYDAKQEVQLLQLQVEEQREIHRATSVIDCFRTTNLRRTIIATGGQILGQAQGTSFFYNFVVVFMGQLGFKDPLRSFVIVTVCGLATNVLSLYAFDKIGRRPLMLYGALIMAGMMLGVGGATANGTANMSKALQSGCVAMLILWFGAYCLSWGPGVWIISGEVGTGQLREHTLFLSTMATFAMSLPINFVNPFVQAAIGGRVALIYGSFSVLSMVFVYFFVPETKGRSLEELDEMFQRKLPTRQFRKYVCTGLGAQIRHLENKEPDDQKEGTITEHVEEKPVADSA